MATALLLARFSVCWVEVVAAIMSSFPGPSVVARIWADSDGTIQTDAPTATSPAELMAILTAMLDLAIARHDDPTRRRSITKLRLKSCIWPSDDVLDKIKAEHGVHLRLDWDGNLDRLDVKVLPSGFHEACHACFAEALRDMITLHGLSNFVEAMAATTIDLGILQKKEGDSTMKPAHRTVQKPSLVIEAGDDESTAQRANDARRWLWSPGTVEWVKIVIYVDAKTFRENGQDRPWIRLTSWQRGDIPSSPLPDGGGLSVPEDVHEPVVRWADDIEYRGRPDEVVPDFAVPLCSLVEPDIPLPPGLTYGDNLIIPAAAMLQYAKKALKAWYVGKGLPVPVALLPPTL